MQVKRLSRVKIDGGQAGEKPPPSVKKILLVRCLGPPALSTLKRCIQSHAVAGGDSVFDCRIGSKILSGICGHTRRSPDIGRESGPDARQFQSPVEKYGKISFKDISLQKA